MEQPQCCRMCLSEQKLNFIFQMPEHSEIYSQIINTTTGLKVEINDRLPKVMCTACISFINDSHKFRKRARSSERHLLAVSEEGVGLNIKSEGVSDEACIDISDFTQQLQPPHSTEHTEDVLVKEEWNDSECHSEDVTEAFDMESVKAERKPRHSIKAETVADDKPPEKRKYVRKKPLLKREKQKKEYKCEFCCKLYSATSSLAAHRQIAHTGLKVVCEHCGKKFMNRGKLLIHCRGKHGYERVDKCSYCDYKGISPSQVKLHERTHTGEKPYVCASCGARFHLSTSYHTHVASHLTEKTVKCDLCPALFKSKTLMSIHRQRHTPRYTYSCRECEHTSRSRRHTVKHLLKVHNIKAQPEHIVRNPIERVVTQGTT